MFSTTTSSSSSPAGGAAVGARSRRALSGRKTSSSSIGRNTCRRRLLLLLRVHSSSSSSSSMDIDPAKLCMERQAFVFVDMRSAKEYENEHIVKPPRQTVNVPFIPSEDAIASYAEKIREKYKHPSTAKLLLVDADGTIGIEVATELREKFGYESVYGVVGGYDGWMVKWTPSGRKRPPKGKFVATGRESLKSGLDLDPEVAATYEENWGNPEASFAANSNRLKEEK